MVGRFSRLKESIKLIVASNKKENVRWADLDAVKQEYMTMQSLLGDKMD